MGKKKSKAAKQKAIRATQKRSISFTKMTGVQFVGNRSSEIKQRNAISTTTVVASTKPMFLSACTSQDYRQVEGRRNRFSQREQKQPLDSSETIAFKTEQQSIRERQMVESQQRPKNLRLFLPEPSSLSNFQSNEEILKETTNRMKALSGIGGVVLPKNEENPSSQRLIHQAPASLEHHAIHYNHEDDFLCPVECHPNNPWATLSDSDEDDDAFLDYGVTAQSKLTHQMLHFHPATFETNQSQRVFPHDDPDL